MRTNFHRIFPKKKKVVIGVIHLPPLLGYQKFPGFKITIANTLRDLAVFERGGVNGLLFENNYDQPHREFVEPSVITSMALIGNVLRSKTKLPLGVSVLWNDYRTALALAKALRLQFIRIPVFVDTVKTNFGVIEGAPKEVRLYQKTLRAEGVALLTDIHVKHAKLLSRDTLTVSAQKAMKAGADAIIITGNWTGQAPEINELKTVRSALGSFPLLIGSGVNRSNIRKLLAFADGAIVSTSVKRGGTKAGEVNVKSYTQRIDSSKVSRLVKASKEKGKAD